MCCKLTVKFTDGLIVETATSNYGDIVVTIAHLLDILGYGETFIERVLASDTMQIRIEREPMDVAPPITAWEVPDGNYAVKR